MTVDPGSIEGTYIPLSAEEQHERAVGDILKEVEDVMHDIMLGEKLKSGGARIQQVEVMKGSGGIFRPTLKDQLRKLLKQTVIEELQAKQAQKLTKAQLEQVQRRVEIRAKKMMEDTAGRVISQLSSEGLTKYAGDIWTALAQVKADAPGRVKLIEQLEAQIERISAFEFVRGVTRTKPIKFVFHTRSLAGVKAKLEKFGADVDKAADTLSDKLAERRDLQQRFELGTVNPTSYFLAYLDDDPTVRAAIKLAEQVGSEYYKTVEQLSIEIANAVRDISFEVNVKALEAYVSQNEEAVEEIDALKEHVGQAIEIVGKAVKATDTGDCFVKLSKWLTVVSAEGAKAYAIQKGMDSYKKEHTKSELLREHNRNPLTLAEDLQRKQKAAMEIFFSTLDVVIAGAVIAAPPGTGTIVSGVWDIVTTTVQEVTKKILEERIERAADAAKKAATDAGETYTKGSDKDVKSVFLKIDNMREDAFKGIDKAIESKLTGEIEKKVAEKANEAAKEITSPETLVGIFGTAYSFEKDADAPSASFDGFAFGALIAGLIVPMVTAKILKFVDVPAAEVMSGDMLAGILQDLSFSGVSVNVAFQKSVTLPPRPEPKQFDGRPEGLPTQVGSKQIPVKRVNASRSKEDKKWYYVSLDFDGVEVWGVYDAATEVWTAAQPDPGSYANWSEIFVAADSITENGTETKGSWDCVKITEMSTTVYAFRPAGGGPLRWGHRLDSVKGGPRGTVEYTLGEQIEQLGSSLAQHRLIEEMPEFLEVNA